MPAETEEAGSAVDDASVSGEEELWRRIPPWHFVRDGNEQVVRPSSAAFDDDPDGQPMSVYLGSVTSDPQLAVSGHTGFALAGFPASLAREHGQKIVRDPQPEAPGHALVVGRKTHGVRRTLARKARWVMPPP